MVAMPILRMPKQTNCMFKANLVTETLSQKQYLKCFTNNKIYFPHSHIV